LAFRFGMRTSDSSPEGQIKKVRDNTVVDEFEAERKGTLHMSAGVFGQEGIWWKNRPDGGAGEVEEKGITSFDRTRKQMRCYP